MAAKSTKLTNSEFIDVLVSLRMAAQEYNLMADRAMERKDGDAALRNRTDADRYMALYSKLSDVDALSYVRVEG